MCIFGRRVLGLAALALPLDIFNYRVYLSCGTQNTYSRLIHTYSRYWNLLNVEFAEYYGKVGTRKNIELEIENLV